MLASEDGRKPAAQRQHDRIRNEIRRQDPRALVRTGRETAGDMRQRHVGDAGIQHFHERRQRDCQRDNPRIDRGPPRGSVIHGDRSSAHYLIQTFGSTDMPGRSS